MHETGHALGLKHPHEVRGSFGAMPLDHDSLEYTVMSYRSYVGGLDHGGYTNGSTSYPQTLMMYDIAALQTMYGANYTTNTGNTVYNWSATTGEMSINGVGQGAPAGNKIFMTIWDGGGNDTYDFSNYTTNLTVNLQPGELDDASRPTQLAISRQRPLCRRQHRQCAALQRQPGFADRERHRRLGQRHDHRQLGQQQSDRRRAATTCSTAAPAVDTALYSGLFAAILSIVQNADGSWTLTDLRSGSPDGIDILRDVELLHFGDQTVALGTVGPAAVPIRWMTRPIRKTLCRSR